MKKTITALFAMIALAFSLNAQSFFTPIFTTGGINAFTQSSFPNSITGYILGTNKALFKTTDAGNSWNIVYTFTGTQDNSFGMKFTDELTGYVSYDGGGYKTTDGGSTWNATGSDLGRLFVYDANTVFNLSNATISNDNGASFTTLTGFNSNILGSLNFQFSEVGHTGIATTSDKVYLTLSNDLTNWTEVGILPTNTFKLDFITTNTGYSIANGNIFKTANSGSSWQQVGSDFLTGNFNAVTLKVISEQSFFVLLSDQHSPYTASGTYLSNDGGSSYVKTELPVSQTISLAGADFFTEDLGYVITDKVFYRYQSIPYISVFPQGLAFPASGGTQLLQVASKNTTWIITAIGSNISFNPSSGNSSTVVTVTCIPNYSGGSIQSEYGLKNFSGIHIGNFPISQAASIGGSNFSVSPETFTFTGAGGTQALYITSIYPWELSISGTGLSATIYSGTGNAVLTITAAPNYSTSSEINGSVLVSTPGVSSILGIWQMASTSAPSLVVSPSSLDYPSSGGNQTVNITTPVTWTITGAYGFNVTPSSGFGNSSVTVTATPNEDISNLKLGSFTVSTPGMSSVVGITQDMSVVGTYFVASSNYLFFDTEGENQTVTVSSSLSWTLTDVTIPGVSVTPTSGTGNTVLTVTALPNYLNQSVVGMLILNASGQPDLLIYTIQLGSTTGYALNLSQTSIQAGPNSYLTTITVTSSPANWSVTGIPNWMSASPLTSSGTSFTLSVSPNFSGFARNLNIYITNGTMSQTIYVSQSVLETSVQQLSFVAEGENKTVTITSNTSWTVQNPTTTGISISPLSGTGNGVITVTAAPNYTTLSIPGAVFVNAGGQQFDILTDQDKTILGENLSISPLSLSVSSIAGTYTITVTSNLSRWWFISVDGVGYLSATTGFDNNTIDLYLPTNTTTSPITIHATVYGYGTGETQMATITQEAGYPESAPPASYLTVSGNNVEIAADGDVQVFQIYSDAYWSITSDDTWYTISTLAGMGNVGVTITGSANSSIFQRSGILYINSSGHSPIAIDIVQDGQTPFITQDSTLTFFTNSPVLYWTTVPGASTYCIQIATDSLFESPLLSICNISSLNYVVPPGILSSAGGNFFRGEQINGQYYWRVAAVSNGVVGSYSAPQKFKIEQILAINGNVSNKVITVNPNPSTGTFQINGYLGNVQLINAQGNVVLESVVTENNYLITTADLPEGIYLLKAGSTIKKLIFE